MKTIASILALCTFALTVPAGAEEHDHQRTAAGRSDVSASTVVPWGLYKTVGGDYTLDNGKTLTITYEQRHLYAALSDKQKVLLLPQGEMQFASANSEIRIQFIPKPAQSLTLVKVTYGANTR